MESTNEQWTMIEPIILKSTQVKDHRGRKPIAPRKVLTVYYGYYEQVHLGRTYPSGIRHTRLAIVVTKNGRGKGSYRISSKCWPKTHTNAGKAA